MTDQPPPVQPRRTGSNPVLSRWVGGGAAPLPPPIIRSSGVGGQPSAAGQGGVPAPSSSLAHSSSVAHSSPATLPPPSTAPLLPARASASTISSPPVPPPLPTDGAEHTNLPGRTSSLPPPLVIATPVSSPPPPPPLPVSQPHLLHPSPPTLPPPHQTSSPPPHLPTFLPPPQHHPPLPSLAASASTSTIPPTSLPASSSSSALPYSGGISSRNRPVSTLLTRPSPSASSLEAGEGILMESSEVSFQDWEDRCARFVPAPSFASALPAEERKFFVSNEPRVLTCPRAGLTKEIDDLLHLLPISTRDCIASFTSPLVSIRQNDPNGPLFFSHLPRDQFLPVSEPASDGFAHPSSSLESGRLFSSSASSSSPPLPAMAGEGSQLFRSDVAKESRHRRRKSRGDRSSKIRKSKADRAVSVMATGSLITLPGQTPSSTPVSHPSSADLVTEIGQAKGLLDTSEFPFSDAKSFMGDFSETDFKAALDQLSSADQLFPSHSPLPPTRAANRPVPASGRYPSLAPPLRILIEPKSLSLEFGAGFEPYFATLALYEISQKQVLRLTEDFHFEANDPSLMTSLITVSKYKVAADDRTRLFQCIFELVNLSPEVHLVLKVYRISRGLDLPVEKMYAPYMKPRGKAKGLGKHQKELHDILAEDGFVSRQPFLWGTIPLLNDQGGLLPVNKISELHPIRGSLSDTLLSEALKEKDRVLGDFTFQISTIVPEQFESMPSRCWSATLPLEPIEASLPPRNLIKIVQGFGNWNASPIPFDHFVNCLYLYPETVSIKTSSNVQIEMIFKSNEGTTINNGFQNPSFHTHYSAGEIFSSVSLKDKKPHFWDEIKIDVPACLSVRHHILVKFWAVGAAASKKRDKNMLGYTIIPLWRCADVTKQTLVPGILPDGRYVVPITTGPLSAGYLQGVANAYPTLVTNLKSKMKAAFTFRLRLVSSVISNEPRLSTFFESLQDVGGADEEKGMAGWDFFLGKSLEEAVNGIRFVNQRLCAQFFPVILNQLFRVMCTRAEESAKTALPAIIDLLKQVSIALGPHTADFLAVYVQYGFQNPPNAKKSIYIELVRHLIALLDQDHAALQNFDHWWFFLDIIFKSLLLFQLSPGTTAVPRKERFPSEFYDHLHRLISLLFHPRRIVTSYFAKAAASISCPTFFSNLMEVCDRGIILEILHRFLERLSPGPQSAQLSLLVASVRNSLEQPSVDQLGGLGDDDSSSETHRELSGGLKSAVPPASAAAGSRTLTRLKSATGLHPSGKDSIGSAAETSMTSLSRPLITSAASSSSSSSSSNNIPPTLGSLTSSVTTTSSSSLPSIASAPSSISSSTSTSSSSSSSTISSSSSSSISASSSSSSSSSMMLLSSGSSPSPLNTNSTSTSSSSLAIGSIGVNQSSGSPLIPPPPGGSSSLPSLSPRMLASGTGRLPTSRFTDSEGSELSTLEDRFKLAEIYQDELLSCDVDLVLLNTKFDILAHLAEDQYFLFWNLPIQLPLTRLTTVKQIKPTFWYYYPLCGEILESTYQVLTTDTDNKPRHVVSQIRNSVIYFSNILHCHLVDETVQVSPTALSQIAGMYFPYVSMVVTATRRLEHDSTMGPEQWLRCLLFVVGNCDEQLLLDYWKLETHSRLASFLVLLNLSLQHVATNRSSRAGDAAFLAVAKVTKLFMDSYREKAHELLDPLFKVILSLISSESVSRALVGYLLVKLFVQYFAKEVFLHRNNYSLALISQIFTHCNSASYRLRKLASSVYLFLLKSNAATEGGYGRIKVHAPVAISQLVGGNSSRDASNLRSSLQEILEAMDSSLLSSGTTTAIDDIKDSTTKMIALIQYTHTISRVTSSDPDLTAELYFKIAKSYVNSPDTRVQWLENLAAHHEARGDHLEAAICLIHHASLVVACLEKYPKTQFLHPTRSKVLFPTPLPGSDHQYVPIDNSHFVCVAPNIYMEPGLPEVDLETNEQFQLESWSGKGLCDLLKKAITLVEQSSYLELSLELYSMLSLIYKTTRDYPALSANLQAYQNAITKLNEVNKGTRILARFYRVSFFGSKAGNLNGKEYIYKRGPASTLQLFTKEMGDALLQSVESADEVVRLDNKRVKEEELDPNKAYYQVAAVKPYTGTSTKSIFEQHFRINQFIFESVHEKTQRKKTIFTCEKYFPYCKNRLQIANKVEICLSPLESAIEDIQERTDATNVELSASRPRLNVLQQIIQGSVVPTVNEGPLRICQDFLAPDKVPQYPPQLIANLRAALSAFIKSCGFAIKLTARLITDESKPLQDVFEKKYEELENAVKEFGVSRQLVEATSEEKQSSDLLLY